MNLLWRWCVLLEQNINKVCQFQSPFGRMEKEIIRRTQGLLYHSACKPDFLCSWPSLNSYIKSREFFKCSASIMDTTLPQKFPFILDRNLAKANCTENRVCTSCDTVVLGRAISTSKRETEKFSHTADLLYIRRL